MQTLTEIKAMLAANGIRPRHRLGQNFLHDHNLIRKLVEAAHIANDDASVILEVGPGTGALTEAIIETYQRDIVLCELDEIMADIITERLDIDSPTSNITLIRGDALASKHSINPDIVTAIGDRPFKLLANLPYSIASPLMMNLLVHHLENCRGMFVTIQKEVADRLLAKPGTKTYGPMTIVAQTFAQIENIATLPPSCFWPQPEVNSAMISIIPAVARDISVDISDSATDRADFARFTTTLFTKRRKQLGSIFRNSAAAFPADIAAELRPDALSPTQVFALWQCCGKSE